MDGRRPGVPAGRSDNAGTGTQKAALPPCWAERQYFQSDRSCQPDTAAKWLFDNVDKTHDDKVGFVDPATEEFDEHMMRDENGRIVPRTQVGIYMYKIFNFSNRLTDVWWKLSVISKEINEIDSLLEKEENVDGLREYRRLHRQFNSFIKSLKDANESI